MKIKQLVSLVVGVTALALSAVTTHAFGPPPPPPPMMGGGGPPMMGGGGGGPPFRGEGAPFGGAGPRLGDGAFRGPRPARPSNFSGRGRGFANSRPHYTATQRQSPASHSHDSAGTQHSSVNRLGTSSEARNNSAERSNSGEGNYSEERSKSASRNNSVAADSATRSGRTAARSNFNGHTAERHNAENWHREWDRQRSHYSDGRYYVYEDGYWYGTDDGSYSYGSDSGSSADAESNDNNSNGYNSNDNNEAVSKDTPAPDPTVTAVQTKLTQLGYYNGAIDGIYGPTTRDAVANYQIAAKLTVTGSLSADTLKSLGLPQGTRG